MRKILFFLVCLSIPSLPAYAQTVEEQMRAMRAEIEALRAEVTALKQEVRGSVPLVQAQVAEFAQTKVESSSRFPVTLSGTIVSNTFWNSNDTDWLDIPNLATTNSGGSFSSSLRQTRVGASVDGPTIGPFQTSAAMAMDFFGGVSNFATGQTLGIPRLLFAYMRLDGDRTAFQIGQDQMILAPRNPTSLAGMSFPSLFRSGNLYLRVPQVRAEQRLASGSAGELKVVGGILAPVAGDLSIPALQFVPPNLAGERSRKPAAQARLSWNARPAGPYEEPQWEFGASGHYGQERYGTATSSSWAWAGDGDATIGRIGFAGEFFMGRNIDAFGGAAGPSLKSHGGFAETRLAVTSELSLNAGYGTDRLNRPTSAPRRNNAGFYANTIYQFTPEFSGSLEYRRQRTDTGGSVSRNNHLNLTFAYSF